jgi:hypothetical protein
MTSLLWKYNRLRLMGYAEIFWRIKQVVQKKANKLGFGVVLSPPIPDTLRFGHSFLHLDTPGSDVASIRAAADMVLSGHWNIFAMKEAYLGFPPDWNRDPKTGTAAPLSFGKEIDYRNNEIVGDIKYLWEPSRHLQLVTILLAWRSTGERRYLNAGRDLLQSWFDQCSYPNGVHWTSSLELAIRILNWACAWHLLGGRDSPVFQGADGERFLRRWLDSIYQHCHFINGNLSKHSSANNHLFGEYMGLFVASVTWPCWKQSAKWQAIAVVGLEEEAIQQNAKDGVNKEQAVYYQHEVMDMMIVCHLVANANGIQFSSCFMERLNSMAEFISAIMNVKGTVPMIGDADDAIMVRLSFEQEWSPYRSLLGSCALLFERSDYKRKAWKLDDKNRWLFGEEGIDIWDRMPNHDRPPKMSFPEGGYYLLGSQFGTAYEVKAVIDCAPLGYLSIAAHGHADALAFTLNVSGEEVLIDPGTYAYHTQKKWRDYFRSTAAHNTVRIDEVDQSEIGGNFMWLRKAEATIVSHSPTGAVQVFEGEHNGYRRLGDPVVHRRRITYYQETGRFIVTDMIDCAERHFVEIFWHFSEDAIVNSDGNNVRLKIGTRPVTVSLSCTNLEMNLSRGSEEPVSGWVSRTFDDKKPATTACFSGHIFRSAKFITEILISIEAERTDQQPAVVAEE